MPQDEDISASLSASFVGGDFADEFSVSRDEEILQQSLFNTPANQSVPYPGASRFSDIASDAVRSAYAYVPTRPAGGFVTPEFDALQLPVPYPNGQWSGSGGPGRYGDGTYAFGGSGSIPFGREDAGRGYADDAFVSGGSGFEGGSGFGGAAAPYRTTYDDQRRYNDRRWQEQQQRWQDTFGDPEPQEATFAGDDFIDVPGKGYDTSFRGRLQYGFDKFKSSKIGEWIGSTEAAWSLGFGGMQSAANLTKALDPLVAGDAYLPDQVFEQSATSALPLIGSILGTLGGARLGPGGAMGGQFIGQGIGAGAEDLIDKYATGHTFAQERAGQAIGEGQGGADAVREVTDALKNALSPAVKELADTLTQVSRSGPVGSSAPNEFGQFQFAMGTAFSRNTTDELSFLGSSPFLNPVRNTFLSSPFSGLSTTDYLGNAAAAAMSGDYAGEKASFAFAEAENDRNSENPAFRRDEDFIKRTNGESFWEKARDAVFFPNRVRAESIAQQRLDGKVFDDPSRPISDGTSLSGTRYAKTDPENKYLPGRDGARQTILDAEKDIEASRNTHLFDDANVLYSEALLGRDSATLSGAVAQGGGSNAIYSALGQMRTDASGAIASLEADIAQNNADALKYTNPAQRAQFRANSAADQTKEATIRAGLDTTAKSAFDTGLGEEEATFGFFANRNTLRGDSAASLQPGYNRQADFLNNVAAGPGPLSPAERAGLAQSADQIRYVSGRNVYDEAQGWAGVRITQGQGAISAAETYGTPMDAYNASIAQIGNEQGEVDIIDRRLKQDIPMSERIPLMNQRQQIINDIYIAPEKARTAYYDAESNILGNDQAAGRANLDRNARVFGAAAFTPDIFSADQGLIKNFTDAENGSPIGSAQRSRFGHERADAEAQLQRDRDSSYQFGNQAIRVGDMQAEGQFDRALKAPYMNGPESNPFTSGIALENVYRRDLAGVDAMLQKTPRDSPAYEYNVRMEEDYKGKIADLEHRRYTEMFSALPESISGAPGSALMAGIVPTSAMTARFTANPIFGSFGAPGPMPTSGVGAIQPGGAAGAFASGSGASNVEALLTKLIMVVQSNGGKLAPPAPYSGAGAVSDTLGRTFNPARPPQ